MSPTEIKRRISQSMRDSGRVTETCKDLQRKLSLREEISKLRGKISGLQKKQRINKTRKWR